MLSALVRNALCLLFLMAVAKFQTAFADGGLDLASVNAMTREAFVNEFGEVFEHSPWVAQEAWQSRPFASVESLHQAMFSAVTKAPVAMQIEFLNQHPELAGKEAKEGTMTSFSEAEQASAGLNALSSDEFKRLSELNAQYREKFGFPFMIFVRAHTKLGIFFYLERRLQNDADTELKNALEQVFGITRLRVFNKFKASSG